MAGSDGQSNRVIAALVAMDMEEAGALKGDLSRVEYIKLFERVIAGYQARSSAPDPVPLESAKKGASYA